MKTTTFIGQEHESFKQEPELEEEEEVNLNELRPSFDADGEFIIRDMDGEDNEEQI